MAADRMDKIAAAIEQSPASLSLTSAQVLRLAAAVERALFASAPARRPTSRP